MFRPSRRSLLIAAAVAALLVTGTSQADAWWGCYRTVSWGCAPCYSACYTPSCYTSCCTVSCDPCCSTSCCSYLGYRRGPIRRLLFGPCRSYSCGWDCCTDCCCTGCTAATSGDSPTPAETNGAPTEVPDTVPVEVPDDAAADPSPVPPDETIEEPAEEPAGDEPLAEPMTRSVPTRENSGLLTIYVPYDAKVTVNGLQTRSKGSRREYVSYGLKPGFAYKYEIRAKAVYQGRPVEEVHTVTLIAGDRKAVAFGFNGRMAEGLASR